MGEKHRSQVQMVNFFCVASHCVLLPFPFSPFCFLFSGGGPGREVRKPLAVIFWGHYRLNSKANRSGVGGGGGEAQTQDPNGQFPPGLSPRSVPTLHSLHFASFTWRGRGGTWGAPPQISVKSGKQIPSYPKTERSKGGMGGGGSTKPKRIPAPGSCAAVVLRPAPISTLYALLPHVGGEVGGRGGKSPRISVGNNP